MDHLCHFPWKQCLTSCPKVCILVETFVYIEQILLPSSSLSQKLHASTAYPNPPNFLLRLSASQVAWIFFNSRNWSSTKKRWSSFVTTKVGSSCIWAVPTALIRSTACWKRLFDEPSPDRTKNCFGNPARDKGQSRAPDPPHRITGVTFFKNWPL